MIRLEVTQAVIQRRRAVVHAVIAARVLRIALLHHAQQAALPSPLLELRQREHAPLRRRRPLRLDSATRHRVVPMAARGPAHPTSRSRHLLPPTPLSILFFPLSICLCCRSACRRTKRRCSSTITPTHRLLSPLPQRLQCLRLLRILRRRPLLRHAAPHPAPRPDVPVILPRRAVAFGQSARHHVVLRRRSRNPVSAPEQTRGPGRDAEGVAVLAAVVASIAGFGVVVGIVGGAVELLWSGGSGRFHLARRSDGALRSGSGARVANSMVCGSCVGACLRCC